MKMHVLYNSTIVTVISIMASLLDNTHTLAMQSNLLANSIEKYTKTLVFITTSMQLIGIHSNIDLKALDI